MHKLLAVVLLPVMTMFASDLPSKKYLNLATIKIMVAAAEAKAKELNVSVTICVVDESGNLLFLEKGETASLNTIQFAQKKARHAAFYGSPSKDAADTVKNGNTEPWRSRNSSPTREACQFASTGSCSAEFRQAARSPKSTNRWRRQASTRF